MEFNDFDWDQKIISDIFFDINYELSTKNIYNKKNILTNIKKPAPQEVIDNEELIEYKDTSEIIQDKNIKSNNIQNETVFFSEDDIFGIKFPYTKKFYIILCFILFIICIYLYNMVSRYDTLLLMILSNKQYK